MLLPAATTNGKINHILWVFIEQGLLQDSKLCLLHLCRGQCQALCYAQAVPLACTALSASSGGTSKTASMVQVYIELGLPPETKLCVFIYGGQPPGEWELRESNLPEGWVCMVCSGGKPILSDKQLPSNFRLAKPDDFVPDMVNKCWCLLAGVCYPAMHSKSSED